jgi:excisionase family DNA binding protein
MLDERYLTVAEVADLFKLNPQTVRNWIDAKELPAIRIGARRVRVRESDLEKYIESHSAKTPSPATDKVADKAESPDGKQGMADLAAAFEAGDRAASQGERNELIAALRVVASAASALADSLQEARDKP